MDNPKIKQQLMNVFGSYIDTEVYRTHRVKMGQAVHQGLERPSGPLGAAQSIYQSLLTENLDVMTRDWPLNSWDSDLMMVDASGKLYMEYREC